MTINNYVAPTRRLILSALGSLSLRRCKLFTSRPVVTSRDLALAGSRVFASGCRARARGTFKRRIPGARADMSLWVDKYRPCSLGRLDYHKEQAAQLRNLVSLRTRRGEQGAGGGRKSGGRAPVALEGDGRCREGGRVCGRGCARKEGKKPAKNCYLSQDLK